MSPKIYAVTDAYVLVTYVTVEGAGGTKRIWLSELPAWFAQQTGALIVNIRPQP